MASQPQESFLHSSRRQWSWPCPLMDYFGILSSWEIWGWCHSMDCLFVSGSKWRTHISTAVTIWDKVNISTTQKTWSFSWFCAWLPGSKEHILQTFSNIRNYEWLTLPLLTARINTSCQVWYSVPCKQWHQHMAAFQDWQLRKDGLSEANHRVPFFLFWKPSLFSPNDLKCFCQPQHLYKQCRDFCGCLSLILHWQQEIL